MSSLRARRIARNPFAFPGGNPGFNPAHMAVKGLVGNNLLTAVCVGQNSLMNVRTGQPGTAASSPTFAMSGLIGPSQKYTNVNDALQFTSLLSTGALTGATMAAIIQVNAIASAAQVILTNKGSGGTLIFINASGNFQGFTSNNLSPSSPIPMVAGNSYFVCMSFIGASNLNFAVVNLNTGQTIINATTTALSAIASDGTPVIGNSVSQPSKCSIAAAMMAQNVFVSASDLAAWAADPWSFWYPGR